jgi:succinate dehydrogenase/fumarate reductase flavoprotein subunit
MSETELRDVDFGTYTEEQFFDDMGRLTQYRCDPDLTEILIGSSFDTAIWMREKGVRFQLGLGRQAFRVDGRFKFWGGLACHIWGGGKELMKALHARTARDGITANSVGRMTAFVRIWRNLPRPGRTTWKFARIVNAIIGIAMLYAIRLPP